MGLENNAANTHRLLYISCMSSITSACANFCDDLNLPMRSFYLISLIALGSVFCGCVTHSKKTNTPAVVPRKPAPARQWGFIISGNSSLLTTADVWEIIAQVRRIPKIDHRIVKIEIRGRDTVRVKTGFLAPSGDGRAVGGGDSLTFHKQGGRWQWNREVLSWNT